MNEIEFRSWNKSSEEMSYAVIIDGVTEREVGNEVLMQYVGRTDTNDKRVFDGDILAFGEDTNNFYLMKWDDRKCRFGIYYRTLEAFDPGMLIFMEVKGNIYENPELVK